MRGVQYKRRSVGVGGGAVDNRRLYEWTGGLLHPEVQLLTLLYTIFSPYPFRIPFIDEWYPFHIPPLELCILYMSFK